MAHKSNSNEENKIIKTYKLKLLDFNFDLDTLFDEYISYYNLVSGWLKQNLSKKVGDVLLPYLDNKKSGYYIDCFEKQNCILANYIIEGSANNISNSVYCVVKQHNIDNYKGNCANISTTVFRRFGYVQNVIANYQSSLSKLTPKIKSKKIDENSTLDDKIIQCCYEITKHDDFNEIAGWEKYIDYITSKCNPKENTVSRMCALFDTFKTHKQSVIEKYNELLIERLLTYDGCIRNNSKKSLTVNAGSNFFKCMPNNKDYGYDVVFPYKLKNGDKLKITLVGNKQLVKLENNVRIELTTILSNPCKCLTLSKSNGNYYAHISCYCDYNKKQTPIKKIVGVDVNTKHSLLSTSICDDGNVKGFVNIYKELLNDNDFKKLIETNKSYKEIYRSLSKSVHFAPIEVEFLYTRTQNREYEYKNDKIEIAISKVLDNLQARYQGVDAKKRNYIAYTKKLRSGIVSYFKLYKKYIDFQKQFDLEQGYLDESTESKETMDKRRFENPFINTPQAQEINTKLKRIENNINGCRNNIIQYANEIFIKNGYDTINLEKLTTSSFKEYGKTTPSTASLLNYHKWKGALIDDVKKTELFKSKHQNYNIIGNNTVEDVTFTPIGEYNYYLPLFYNVIIKRVHFADIKDRFVLLSNNTNMNICLVPSFYTSQMDSTDHKLFIDENGKLVNKDLVRTTQEKFINGLNADYNAACNIAHQTSDEKWLKIIFNDSKPKYKYSTPTLESHIKNQYTALDRIKKMGAVKKYIEQ